MKKTVAIVQARMGSTRLPGKVLLDVAGRPLLGRVVSRLRAARGIDQVLVATSTSPADDAVAEFCLKEKVDCFRGSEADVLDRFYQAAQKFGATVVVRVTADCPLLDPEVVDKVVSVFEEGGLDYVSNTLRYTYPDGLDVEVFSFKALEAAWQDDRQPAGREHVTPFIRSSGKFRTRNVDCETDLSRKNFRWTVDEPRDLEFVRNVYSRLGNGPFGWRDVLSLLEREPALMTINENIISNEGYYKSLAAEPAVPVLKRSLKISQELKAKAEKLIPGCSQTFSKAPTQFVQGVAPVFLERGEGSHVWDVDGNEYIDYPMALGPIILGHNDPDVSGAVARQMKNGTAYSLPHPLEIEVAEMLVDLIPCAEMVRYGKNGSDATSGAVRAARAYTGRDIIACCGYHGWQDWFIGTTTRNKGVPAAVRSLTVPFDYNSIESLEKIFAANPGKVAAVIMEAVGVVPPKDGFLEKVRALATREGALLIFDEVVTGFRLSLGGAQEYYKVTPDLACFGKAMANGFPIAAVVGRRDIMPVFDEIFFSFTFGGETMALAAAKATIRKMKERNVIGHLWEQGRKLKDGYNVLAKAFGAERYTECVGLSPRTLITFKDSEGKESLVHKSLFQQECLKRGILFSGGQNVCFSHSDADVERTLRVYRAALEILADAIKKGDVEKRLEGPPVKPVFRRF